MQRSNQKYLLLTCDTEAVPSAAPNHHVDRLIWGKLPEAPYEAGIGKMMDIAEEFGVKVVFFHDVLEAHRYGDETARAARYIVSRGHDLQLHMHTEFLPQEFWAEIGRKAPTWSMNLYNPEAATHVMRHGVELFEQMAGFRPRAYRAGAFRYNAHIIEALAACDIPLSFDYFPASVFKPSYPHGFDAGILPLFKWSNGITEVPLGMNEYPHPRQHNFRYRGFELNQISGGAEQAHQAMREFWDNGPTYTVCVMLLHSWSFLQKNDAGHFVWKDDSLVNFFTDFLRALPSDVRVITAAQLLSKISEGEIVPEFEMPIQVAGTEGIPLLSLSPGTPTAGENRRPQTTFAAGPGKPGAVQHRKAPVTETAITEALKLHEEKQRESRRRLVESLPFPTLEEVHLRGAQLLCSREQLLEHLPKHGIVCEIGIAEGDFSAQILGHCRPARLHLVDTWDAKQHSGVRPGILERFAEPIRDGLVTVHTGTSVSQLAAFPDYLFDWIYLDTSHDYQATAQELAICRMKVKPGGIIAGHDHTPGNIVTPVCYGVVQAVQEFCVQHRWRYLFLTCESHCYASFAIQPIDALATPERD